MRYSLLFIFIFLLLTGGCASKKAIFEDSQASGPKAIDGYIFDKPLEVLRKHVIEEIKVDGADIVDTGEGLLAKTNKNGEVLSYKGPRNGAYPGYKQVRNVNEDRFFIISKDVSYEGIRLGSKQSILRISNANKGRLIEKEREFFQKVANQ